MFTSVFSAGAGSLEEATHCEHTPVLKQEDPGMWCFVTSYPCLRDPAQAPLDVPASIENQSVLLGHKSESET